MKIRKFQADDMKGAIAEVKRELGAEAMVLSTRQIRRGLLGVGVEVTAAVDAPDHDGDDAPAAYGPTRMGGSAANMSEGDIERIIAPLRSELRSLRSLIRPLAELRADDLLSEVAAMRQQLASVAGGAGIGSQPPLSEVAARHTLAMAPTARRLMLVGPTGVGKTTTIAKLAARAALIDHNRVAIVTLDTYRVGGEDQIRTFADLMGVPLHVVHDPSLLADTVESLVDRDRVFIDTAGRSPRDPEAVVSLERALGALGDIEIHLALAASTARETADACFRRYKPIGIDKLVITKVDEAEELSELVRMPARLGRPVSYITTGQRVPEDIEPASTERLLTLAAAGFTPVREEMAA